MISAAAMGQFVAYSAPYALREYESCGELPLTGERDGRNREDVDRVPDEREEPIAAGLVDDIAGDATSHIVEEFADAGCHGDHCGARPEHGEERAVHARAAGIGHVSKEIHYAHEQDEAEGRGVGEVKLVQAIAAGG